MDATRFKCVARNEAGVDSISYTVDVNIPPVIENVRNTEQIIIEGRAPRTNQNSSMKNPSGEPWKGESVIFRCPAQGMPEPLITWTQNGRPVNENKVILQQGGRSLIVNNVDRADAGEYICRAQNAAGQDMQKYELEIHIPPKIIEGSPTETAFKETIRGENLEISCDFDFTYPKECFRSGKLFFSSHCHMTYDTSPMDLVHSLWSTADKQVY